MYALLPTSSTSRPNPSPQARGSGLSVQPLAGLLWLVCTLVLGASSLSAQDTTEQGGSEQRQSQAPNGEDRKALVPPGFYTLGGIAIEGVEYTDKQTIISLTGLQVGQEIELPGNELAKAIERLWEQRIFDDIRIVKENLVDGKLFITFQLTERPRMSRYRFTGVKKSHAEDLREELSLVTGTILTQARKNNALRIITNYYQEKGYLNVETTIRTEADPVLTNSQIVTFEVQRGPKVKIDEIIIRGNKEVSDNKLERKMKDTRERKWWRIWKRSKFIRGDFEQDKLNLLAHLQSKGYRDAKILKDSLVRKGDKLVDVYIDIVEGKQYYFGQIEWIGNSKYTNDQLDRVLGIKTGQLYDPVKLETRLQMDPNGNDVSSLYLDDGYLFFRAEPVETQIRGDTIDLEIRITEGPQATYDRIILEGNTKTSDHVVLREIRTLPGNKFSRSELIRSQREIVNLGFFDPEQMDVTPIPDPATGTVDIKYKVTEKPSDQVFFQGGWGGRITDSQGNTISSGLVLTVGLTFTNFSTRKFFEKEAWRPLPSGDGQRLSLQVQVNGSGFQNYGLSFTEPWLGGRKPNTLGVSLNYSLQNSPTTDYRFAMLNSSLTFGRRMSWPDDFFRSRTSLNYRHYSLREAGAVFAGIDNGQIHIFSVQQVFDRTSIDAPIFPRSGSSVSFSVEATPPYSLFSNRDFSDEPAEERFRLLEFHKWSFQAQTYFSLTRNKLPLVITPRVMFGLLGLYNSELGMSPFERYYLGGDGLQGFNIDGREIIALRGYNNPSIGTNTGATVYTKYTLELRQPVSLSQQATIWLVAFAEAGNAWEESSQFNPFELKRSVGVGVRLFLPIFGLLGIDYGWGLDETKNNITNFGGGFHFMIGQQF